jgi:hypothetical protein
MGRSQVGTSGGVTSINDSLGVSLDIGLGLCIEFGEV